MGEHPNPQCNRWAVSHRTMSGWRLISHQATFSAQGFYAHRIHILARSKKVAGVIIAVRSLLHLKSEYCKNFARYIALFHSTWRWDSSWGWCRDEETSHLVRGRQIAGHPMECHWGIDNHAGLFPIIWCHHLQMWTVGGALCDIIIAVCMTYYVGFRNFPPERNQISYLFCDGSFRDMILPSKRPK